MKSKQINFYMMPDDVAGLEAYLVDTGWVILPDRGNTISPVTISYIINNKHVLFYFALESQLNQIKYRSIDNKNLLIVDAMESPVIEFFYPTLNFSENKINPGRIYFDLTCFNKEKSEIVLKNQIFINAANRFFKDFKKIFGKNKFRADFASPSFLQKLESFSCRTVFKLSDSFKTNLFYFTLFTNFSTL